MLEMCLRTLELFSVFIGFIFMFLYLYKHTSHYPPRKRSDRTLQNVARAFTAIRRTIHKHRTLLVCVELFLEEQGCTVQGTRSLLYSAVRRVSAGQPFNPGSFQCGSVLSTDWSSSCKSLSTLPNKSHFPSTSGRIFATPPSKR